MKKFLDKIEEEVSAHCGTMLDIYQLGMCLKVMEDRLRNYDGDNAQRCNDLQHKLLNE